MVLTYFDQLLAFQDFQDQVESFFHPSQSVYKKDDIDQFNFRRNDDGLSAEYQKEDTCEYKLLMISEHVLKS